MKVIVNINPVQNTSLYALLWCTTAPLSDYAKYNIISL